MSDINLQFTWWDIALFLLATVFWPLTLVAAIAVLWAWRRPSRPAQIVAGIALLFWAGSAVTNLLIIGHQAHDQRQYEADVASRQRKLAQSTVVGGMRLPAGTVVTREPNGGPNDVEALDLPEATVIQGVPVVGHVRFGIGALDGDLTLARDAVIGGVPCSAGAPVRFGSGSLAECRLARAALVHGIPCTGDVRLEQGVMCALSHDYIRYGSAWRAETKITDFGDLVWFHIGSLPPSMRVFGTQLPAESEVQFNHGYLASVDLRSNPVQYRGCAFDLIMISGDSVSGRAAGACSLPQAPSNIYIGLPANTVRPR